MYFHARVVPLTHQFSLTELCVGVSVSSMPALAKFVQHHFPNFSVVDSVISFKSSMLRSHYGTAKVTSLGSASQDHTAETPRISESNKTFKKSGAHFDVNSMELGNLSYITACENSNVAVSTDSLDGIRVWRAWGQTSQQMESTLGQRA